MLNEDPSEDTIKKFFHAIDVSEPGRVRDLLLLDKCLTLVKHKSEKHKYENEYELDAYKFLGAYIGPLTGLQFAILKGDESIAMDIIEATLDKDEFNALFGGNNTALHLATFLGQKDVVIKLLERGADRSIRNLKGFTPVDVVDDEEMRKIFCGN